MSPKLGSCAGWVGWGSGDLVPKNQQTPTCSPLHLNGLWRACFVLSTYSPQSNMFLFVKVAQKKKKSHLWFVGKLRDSLKSCYIAFPLLMSMCLIYMVHAWSVLCLLALSSWEAKQWFSSGCCSLGIMLDSVDLALGPHICRVKSSLGDSDVQLWLKLIEID